MRKAGQISARKGFLSRLRRDESGNVLALVAAGLIPLMAMIGGGIDASRAYMVKSRLQQACDAGVLAGRKAVGEGTFDAAAEQQATAFFNANFDEGYQSSTGLNFDASSPDGGTTIEGTANVVLPTVVMYIFGKEQISLSVACGASLEVANADITLVLDTTGSMAEAISNGTGGTTTRILALRAAMKNFYDTLSDAAAGTQSRMRFAFVPYTGTVNVGALLRAENVNYLDSTHSYQSRIPIFVKTETEDLDDGLRTTGGGTLQNYYESEVAQCDRFRSDSFNSPRRVVVTADLYRFRTSEFRDFRCRRIRTTYTYGTADEIATPRQFATWQYQQVAHNNLGNYIAGNNFSVRNGNDGSPVNYRWGGCIQERSTVASGQVVFGGGNINPAGMDDLDIDGVPASSEEGWKPYFPEISYWRFSGNNYEFGSSTTGTKAQTNCPRRAQLLTQMSKTAFDDYADSLNPDGGTYHDIGAIWGARLSSPDGIFADNVNEPPSNAGFVGRHMIFMTDGQLDAGITYHSAYGLELWDRRITDDGFSNQDARHIQRFRAICDAVRAKGIRVWVIAFATDLNADMTACASANSAFVSTNATELNETFVRIAESIADLRLTQ